MDILKYSKKNINFIIYSLIAFLFSSLVCASVSSDDVKKLRYIIKVQPKSTLEDSRFLIKSKLEPFLGHDLICSVKISRIIDSSYTVELPLNINKYNKSKLSNIENILNNDPDIAYFRKDRVGYFNPYPENVLVNANDIELEHAAQWNHFQAPAGIKLESEAFLSDLAWGFWNSSKEINSKNFKNPVIVGVLDTGIEYNSNLHENILKSPKDDSKYFGWNFSGGNDDLTDETGRYHGTHVAGIISAHGPKVYGVTSSTSATKPNVKILPLKIPDGSGLFYESEVIRAIYWAAGAVVPGIPRNIYPAHVLNMSFGIDEYVGKETETCSPAVQEAIDYAIGKNITIVVAAGNNNKENDLGSPGGCTGVIRVASTGPTGLRSYFSNYGEGVNFAAPGGDRKVRGPAGAVLSTVKDGTGCEKSGFDFYNGTSMAAPHVAGVVALIIELNAKKNEITPREIENLLSTTAQSFGENKTENTKLSCTGEKSCGHGIVDAHNALTALQKKYDILFRSPSSRLLELKTEFKENFDAEFELINFKCSDGKMAPSKRFIDTAQGVYELQTDTLVCQEKFEYNNPTTKVIKDFIVVYYGDIAYTLHHEFSDCEKIGYDGYGCYK